MLVKLPLCLLAGAVVTWGMAWGCAIRCAMVRQEIKGVVGNVIIGGEERIGVHKSNFLVDEWTFFNARAPGAEPLFPPEWSRPDQLRGVLSVVVDAYGFPMRSMYQSRTEMGGLSPKYGNSFTLQRRPKVRRVPVGIIPLGFAVDTLATAGVVLVVVESFAFARRRVRRGKGRCPSCGYDRGGLARDAACPECGACEPPRPLQLKPRTGDWTIR
jgi:hypothetical protein